MAVTLNIVPELTVLAGNPVIAELESDNSTTGSNVLASHTLTFISKAGAGRIIELSVLNGQYEIIFTAAATDDQSGHFFISGTGVADSAYVASNALRLAKNILVQTYYDITTGGLGGLDMIFTAKQYGEDYNVVVDASFSSTPTALVAGSIITQQEFFGLHAILFVYEAAAWEKLTEIRVTPDGDGIGIIDFKDPLKSTLDALQYNVLHVQFPDDPANDWIKEQSDLIRKFKFRYSEYYGQPYLPEYKYQDSSDFYAIPGGYSQEVLALLNADSDNFYDTLVADKMFLTWQSTTKKYHYQQFARLFFLNLASTATISLMCQPTFLSSSAVAQTLGSISTPSQYGVLENIISPQEIINELAGITPPGEYLVRYRLWLEDAATSIISEIRTIIIDYENYENLRFFMYTNSYGVEDTIYTVGLGVKSHKYARATALKALDSGFENTHHQTIDVSVIETDVQKVNTGYVDTIAELDSMRDFLISKRIFEIIDDQLIPIKLLTNKVVTITDDKFYYSLEFEYQRGYETEYFSNKPQ